MPLLPDAALSVRAALPALAALLPVRLLLPLPPVLLAVLPPAERLAARALAAAASCWAWLRLRAHSPCAMASFWLVTSLSKRCWASASWYCWAAVLSS